MKTPTYWITTLLTGLLSGTAPAAMAAESTPAPDRDWSFEVTPYLWLAHVGLDTSLPSLPSGSSDVARFESKIRAGAMITAQARYRSVGVLADFAWLRLDTEATDPGPAYSEVNLRSDFIHSTVALTYQLPLKGKFHAEGLAGARLWHVANDFAAAAGVLPGFDGSNDKTWVDPMIGANLRYDLSQRWSAEVKGLVGGFGVAADIAAEVYGGVSYRFTDHCSALLGYRYLHEEYDRGGFAFDMDAHGCVIGVGFRF